MTIPLEDFPASPRLSPFKRPGKSPHKTGSSERNIESPGLKAQVDTLILLEKNPQQTSRQQLPAYDRLSAQGFGNPLLPVNQGSLGEVSQQTERELHLTLKPRSVLPRTSPIVNTPSRVDHEVRSRLEVEPNPDWDLKDLSAELDRIVNRNGTTPSPLRLGAFSGGKTHSGTRHSCIGLTEVTDFGRPRAPFVIRAPDFEDEEEDGAILRQSVSEQAETLLLQDRLPENVLQKEDPATSSGRSWEESLLPQPDVVEAALFELEKERLARVKEDIRARWRGVARQAEQAGRQEAQALEAIEQQRKQALQRTKAKDEEDQRGIAEARDAYLSALQRDHEQREAANQRRLREAESAARAAAEAEAKRRAQEEAARAEEERRQEEKQREEERARQQKEDESARQRDNALKKEQDAQKQKEIELQRTKESAAKKEEEERSAREKEGRTSNIRITESAAKVEAERLERLARVRESVKAFGDAPATKKERRALDRRMTMLVQQISATQRQVNLKSAEIVRELRGVQEVAQNYLMLALSDKFLNQCESQVQKLPSFAFPLAQVAINVAAEVPAFLDVLLARLHEACCFTVPKYIPYIQSQYESEAAYYRAVGYREEDGKLESTDAYVGRMTGIMVFYAAMTQTDPPGGCHVHGLEQAWSWIARLLNGLPPNRGSGSALESMIKVAGYRLNQAYRKQFRKVLDVVMGAFIPKLRQLKDTDVAPVINRIETYVATRSYERAPEGRDMPVSDESSTLGV